MMNLPVPSVPESDHGVAWLRANVVRFSEGAAHTRRRALVERELAGIDVASLLRHEGEHHVAVLARAMGLGVSVADVQAVAACYQPHLAVTPEADAAIARLVAACGGVQDELTAARIGLLVQACDATAFLIEGRTPPVPLTRRIGADGAVVEVDLTGRPFGEGRHACPGRAHASALAASPFYRLHHGDRPLVLPNAWDFASAAALVEAGFPAIGTTSLGVAATHGVPDAAGATLDETLSLARTLVRLPVPITVDVESGFGVDPRELAARLWEIGVAGVNVEDAAGDAEAHARVVRGFKDGAPGLFVNARIDTHWLGIDRDGTLERAVRYTDAGADGLFVPGLVTDEDITAVIEGTTLPLNVLAQRPVNELARLGVKRVSTGSLLYRAALETAVTAALAVRESGPVGPAVGYEQVVALIDRHAVP
ncbi:isocitrate lyase/PEP mutase family protein [Nocardia jejuensis]|uniref:isocitrate lyase/PEP mutase family protein n=1 Tax=Nocardia jejuensis TaxID=328049 RepID=UPI00082B3ACA|nr:isocitrate lyase/phosphoenolpyruvate mutase family protein [Nocardia jejuensis]